MSEKIEVPAKKKFIIGQDWASVAIGFGLILFVVLLGGAFTTPSFGGKAGWNSFSGVISVFNSAPLGISMITTILLFGIFS
ncbi:MAG: hypothetical protein MUP53_04225, partial [Bacteroidales bacterium]|nr:hypothetical protein [Bacteroidales bacterium]